MQFKRPQILLTGLLLFFAGVQFRLVESFTLSEKSTHVISAQMGDRGGALQSLWQAGGQRKTIEPPRWLGLALMSVGSVLTLKSMSMKGSGSGER